MDLRVTLFVRLMMCIRGLVTAVYTFKRHLLPYLVPLLSLIPCSFLNNPNTPLPHCCTFFISHTVYYHSLINTVHQLSVSIHHHLRTTISSRSRKLHPSLDLKHKSLGPVPAPDSVPFARPSRTSSFFYHSITLDHCIVTHQQHGRDDIHANSGT
jgi:hypothetical protein